MHLLPPPQRQVMENVLIGNEKLRGIFFLWNEKNLRESRKIGSGNRLRTAGFTNHLSAIHFEIKVCDFY
jgi:hypothetical protein